MLEERPFSKTTIKEHLNKGGVQTPVVKSRLIASPMLNGKSCPSHSIGKSPVIQKRSKFLQNEIKKTVSPFINKSISKHNPDEKTDKEKDEKEKAKVNVNRKIKNAFKNIENLEKSKFFEKNEDLPVTSCTYTGQADDK